MKVCRKCGRAKKNKRWVVLENYKIAHARTMLDLEETHCPACLRHAENFVATLESLKLEVLKINKKIEILS